jgi:hypothetical protein
MINPWLRAYFGTKLLALGTLVGWWLSTQLQAGWSGIGYLGVWIGGWVLLIAYAWLEFFVWKAPKAAELKKLSRAWRVVAVLGESTARVGTWSWLYGVYWYLIGGGRKADALVWVGVIAVLLGFGVGSVVLGANRRVGFYEDDSTLRGASPEEAGRTGHAGPHAAEDRQIAGDLSPEARKRLSQADEIWGHSIPGPRDAGRYSGVGADQPRAHRPWWN